ncbi:hypothetical protein JT358_15025 [Micrococcales bacterium 31B]|nr:hypothetical protein [Micrococcales bacterium 31B]
MRSHSTSFYFSQACTKENGRAKVKINQHSNLTEQVRKSKNETSSNRGGIAALLGLFQNLAFLPASTNDPIAELVALNHGVTYEQMLDSVQQAASASGKSQDDIAANAIRELRQAKVDASVNTTFKSTSESTLGAPNSGKGGNLQLPNAVHKGDIFVAPAGLWGLEFGHTGIYYSTSSIIEAPGFTNSRLIPVSGYKVFTGTVLQYVSAATQSQRDSAANYAFNSMRNRPYNYNFAINRIINGPVNCSQLVWVAYVVTTKFDIDSNRGSSVFPFDIRSSSYTITYKAI